LIEQIYSILAVFILLIRELREMKVTVLEFLLNYSGKNVAKGVCGKAETPRD